MNTRKPILSWRANEFAITSGTSWLTITAPGVPPLRLRGRHAEVADALASCLSDMQFGKTNSYMFEKHAISVFGKRAVLVSSPAATVSLNSFVLSDLRRWLRYCCGGEPELDGWDDLGLLHYHDDGHLLTLGAGDYRTTLDGRARIRAGELLLRAAEAKGRPGPMGPECDLAIQSGPEGKTRLFSTRYGRFWLECTPRGGKATQLSLSTSSLGYLLLHGWAAQAESESCASEDASGGATCNRT